jgi:hypothetical protein
MAGRFFSGNHPAPHEGWQALGQVKQLDSGDELSFTVYAKPPANGWTALKVCADKRVRDKANYWLAWNGDRFSNSTDYKLMVQHKSALADMMADMLKQLHSEPRSACDPY